LIYNAIVYTFFSIYAVVFVLYGINRKKLFKLLLFNSFFGLAVLMFFNLIEPFSAILIKINCISVAFSSVLGVPGFGLYIFIDKFFL
jgi:hypothetical protein